MAITYQVFCARSHRVLGEFDSLDAARATFAQWDDIFVMRCEDDLVPELVWET